jgi:hypothetical protein
MPKLWENVETHLTLVPQVVLYVLFYVGIGGAVLYVVSRFMTNHQ